MWICARLRVDKRPFAVDFYRDGPNGGVHASTLPNSHVGTRGHTPRRKHSSIGTPAHMQHLQETISLIINEKLGIS